MPHPSADDFQQWRENPVTRWVCAALNEAAEENKAAWIEASWGEGKADEAMLAELRIRADAYKAMSETPYEGWVDFNGGEPDAE